MKPKRNRQITKEQKELHLVLKKIFEKKKKEKRDFLEKHKKELKRKKKKVEKNADQLSEDFWQS